MYGSYSTNNWVHGYVGDTPAIDTTPDRCPRKNQKIGMPDRAIAVTENARGGSNGWGIDYPKAAGYEGVDGSSPHVGRQHNLMTNILYADGHVQTKSIFIFSDTSIGQYTLSKYSKKGLNNYAGTNE
jgi:prepilin-type processing-associated H-X9-DG protein